MQVDYNTTSDTLTFAAGSGPGTTLTFNVPIIDDNLVEMMEEVPLTASVNGGSSVGTFTAGGNTATIEINDNDGKYDCHTPLFSQYNDVTN